MLKAICSISVLVSSVLLTACGQSGALQLPSDPNHDKRAKYLLYKNEVPANTASSEVIRTEPDAEQPASLLTPSQTTTP